MSARRDTEYVLLNLWTGELWIGIESSRLSDETTFRVVTKPGPRGGWWVSDNPPENFENLGLL